jgi:hypothetical protein
MEGVVPQRGATELLADEGELHQRQTHPAVLAMEERGPPAALPHIGTDPLQLGLEDAPSLRHPLLQRLDALGHEGADGGEEVGDAGRGAEFHDGAL